MSRRNAAIAATLLTVAMFLLLSCNHVRCDGTTVLEPIVRKNGNPDSLKATMKPAPKDTNDGWVQRCVPRP